MKRSRMIVLSVLGGAALVGALAASWYAYPVRTIEVTGNSFIPDRRAAELAGVRENFGWLYYGKWRADALEAHPWVRTATVTRVWPDTVRVSVVERTPAVRLAQDGREVVLDWDMTVLPGAPKVGPLVSGWGPDRSREAVKVARLLSAYDVQSVSYTPSGLKVKMASGTVWSGSYVSLQKYAASVRMYPGQRVNIYPWGVSVQE